MRFIYVPCPHTSEVLVDVLYECLLDWNLDRKLLQLFYEVTVMFSGSKYPTANVFFPSICEIRYSLVDWTRVLMRPKHIVVPLNMIMTWKR
ncbi:hypothetical protein L6452_11473 [Arctium lappa]|uniref:Uncharacterized protein n=1 Tax=Arctium lappa TaxID=4217 RepID=A0ACB9DQD0_ARCLA|nr:hypothetical protein L6452_11473 [Arctium lappa]